MKVGLVLSGGGAKGAYQVGVAKALVEVGARVDAISGASIGSLNGAVLASAPSFAEGTRRLEELWLTLAESPPIEANLSSNLLPSYLKLLMAGGLHSKVLVSIEKILKDSCTLEMGARLVSPHMSIVFSLLKSITSQSSHEYSGGILSNSPIKRLMDEYLDIKTLQSGLPLYVSLYSTNGAGMDIIRIILSEFGLYETPDSEYYHVQSLPNNQQRQALLASAAIPLLFEPIEVNGKLYSDGGQGGWQRMKGNTPITPLLKNGCDKIIITHLTDGSLWSRHDYPEASILEIRPNSQISRDGNHKDMLGFDVNNIKSWIEQGYNDTKACVGKVMRSIQTFCNLKDTETQLEDKLADLECTAELRERSLRRLLDNCK